MENFKTIEGFGNYEISNDRQIVRNIKTKVVQHHKKGTGRYYLLNGEGKRKLVSLSEIKIKEPDIQNDIKPVEGKSIMFNVSYLHYKGLSKEKIIELLGIKPKNYNECVWRYCFTGYRTKIEKYLQK